MSSGDCPNIAEALPDRSAISSKFAVPDGQYLQVKWLDLVLKCKNLVAEATHLAYEIETAARTDSRLHLLAALNGSLESFLRDCETSLESRCSSECVPQQQNRQLEDASMPVIKADGDDNEENEEAPLARTAFKLRIRLAASSASTQNEPVDSAIEVPAVVDYPYTCKTCGEQFSGISAFRRHRTSHYNLVCKDCGYKTKSQHCLRKHKAACRKKMRSTGKTALSMTATNMCKDCGLQCSGRGSLERHRKTHFGLSCAQCGYKTKSQHCLRKHEAVCPKCKDCGLQCSGRGSLERHRKTHFGLSCEQCGYKTKSLIVLSKHVAKCGTAENLNRVSKPSPFIIVNPAVPECSSATTVSPTVDTTIADTTRPAYSCKICGMQVHGRRPFERHRKTHYGLSCGNCGYKTKSLLIFRKHTAKCQIGIKKKTALTERKPVGHEDVHENAHCMEDAASAHTTTNSLSFSETMPSDPVLDASVLRSQAKVSFEAASDSPTENTVRPAYSCKTCGVQVHGRRAFERHRKSHFGLSCKDCGYKTKSMLILKKHMAKCATEIDRKKRRVRSAPFIVLNPADDSKLDTINAADKSNQSFDKGYTCKRCGEYFAGGLKCVAYRRHTLSHWGLTCEQCGFKAKSELIMNKHLTRCRALFQCAICGRVKRGRVEFLEHLRTSHGTLYTCDICGAQRKHKSSYQNHMRRHADAGFLICSQCNFKTASRAIFDDHKHGCGKEFRCGDCGHLEESSERLSEHKRSHVRGAFTCGICGRQKSSSYDLNRHMETHQETVVCDNCGYKSKSRSLLRRHRLTCGIPFQCAVCGVLKDCKERLMTHLTVCHPKDRYMCEVCSLLLKNNQALNQHLKSHTAQKTLKCDQCDYRTWCKLNLKCHRLTHGEKTLRCPHAGCTRVFKRRGTLRLHIQHVHSGVRPYACNYCEWTFVTPDCLKRHLQSHTGDRPYPCLICGYPFSRQTNRRVHMRTVHKLDPSDPRLQPNLPEAYAIGGEDSSANQASADVSLAVQSEVPNSVTKIRHRRRRLPPFSMKSHSASRISVPQGSKAKQVALTHHVTSPDRAAPIVSTNEITPISANQVASIINASQVATNPNSHVAFNPSLTVPEVAPSTALGPSCDVASFYNPQFLDPQFFWNQTLN